jgi:uncharacterized protein (TIGR02246 family)
MSSSATKLSSKEEGVILKRIEEFVTAWNAHDPRAMSMLHAEDADLINPSGRAAKSRTEIETLLKQEHSRGLKDSRLSLKFEAVRFLAPDAAVTDHAYELSGVRDPAGNPITVRGHLTQILKKGETWQIVVSRPMIPLTNLESK